MKHHNDALQRFIFRTRLEVCLFLSNHFSCLFLYFLLVILTNNNSGNKSKAFLMFCAEINKINQMKSDLVYELIDSSDGFYW